jgi:two-component system, OmpR family, response regulator VicR
MEQKKINILYVEDDANLGLVVREALEQKGYQVRLCADGRSAIQKFSAEPFDLCILDIMLPHVDGFEVASFFRKINSGIPIIFLTAKSMSEDKIKGLKLGADDYVTKPFDTGKLGGSDHQGRFMIGNYEFDHKNYLLKKGDSVRNLTDREANLLKILCISMNQVVTREILLKSVWGKDDYFTGRSMDVFISKLRKYLADDPRVKIQSMHGIGFKLATDVGL